MKELSIFVDEAGVLGPFKKNDPYYVLSFVFHNQEQDINEELLHLEENFTNLGFKAQSFHAGPIIRREEEYRVVDREVRKKLFMTMISFVRRTPIQCKSIYVEKKHLEDAFVSFHKKTSYIVINTEEISKCSKFYYIWSNSFLIPSLSRF